MPEIYLKTLNTIGRDQIKYIVKMPSEIQISHILLKLQKYHILYSILFFIEMQTQSYYSLSYPALFRRQEPIMTSSEKSRKITLKFKLRRYVKMEKHVTI